MKILSLFMLVLSSSSFAINSSEIFSKHKKVYECFPDSQTKAKVTVEYVEITPNLELPYVKYEALIRGVRKAYVGLATIENQTFEVLDRVTRERSNRISRTLHLAGLERPAITYGNDGDAENCTVVEEFKL